MKRCDVLRFRGHSLAALPWLRETAQLTAAAERGPTCTVTSFDWDQSEEEGRSLMVNGDLGHLDSVRDGWKRGGPTALAHWPGQKA